VKEITQINQALLISQQRAGNLSEFQNKKANICEQYNFKIGSNEDLQHLFYDVTL